MAEDNGVDVEIADDQDVENVVADIASNLMLVSDDIDAGLLDEAVETFALAQRGMEAIKLYLTDKINQRKK